MFWTDDLLRFITPYNYMSFLPNKNMDIEEQLNSLARMALYFSCVMIFLKRDVKYIFFFVTIALFTMGVMYFRREQEKNEQFALDKLNLKKRYNKYCYVPTQNNPFMNVSHDDMVNFANRPKACDVRSKQVQYKMKKHFDKNLYRNADDIFHKQASDRQFVTNPVTTIPNDQEGFANWLYKTEKTCKEGNMTKCKSVNTFDYLPFL